MNERERDIKIMNNEPEKLMKAGTEGTRAPVVPVRGVESLGRCGKRPYRARPDFGGDYRAGACT